MRSHKKKIRVGDKVKVNKDIFRVEERYEYIERLGFEPTCTLYIKWYETLSKSEYDEKIIECRSHYKLYANAGEIGRVIDIFHDRKRCDGIVEYAKVLINDKIKTFRFGSIDLV